MRQQVANSRSSVVQTAIRNVQASRRRLSPVTDEIGSMIVSGELKEGEALSERMFGDIRSVSRTSFREAIKVLEGKGLVRARQNTGTLVAPRSDWHLLDPEILAWRIGNGDIERFIQDFFAFRRSIEPPAAEAAAGFRDEVRIAEMRRAYEDMCDLEASRPFGDEYVDADVRFHQAIFQASGNEFLMAMGYILYVPLTLSFTLHSSLQVGPTNRLTLHNDVLTAIETGGATAARTASLALLSDVAHDVGRIVDTID
jgi:DNA-binding FadR family transcriptional regulator